MKKTLLLLPFLLFCQFAKAQYSFSGVIADKEKIPLMGVQVMLSANDSLFAAGLTNAKGRFAIESIPKGVYLLQISHPGFTSIEEKRDIHANINAEFTLVEEMDVELDDSNPPRFRTRGTWFCVFNAKNNLQNKLI